MEEKKKMITNPCSFNGIRPAMVDLPYPPIQVSEANRAYADLLSVDYCGAVSELSAITQYINNENRISYEKCAMAKVLLSIAVAEMMHLQKLGDFTAKMRNGKRKMWTPEYLSISENVKKMLLADVEAERGAIRQYEMHIQMIADPCVNAVLERIIKDEEYHIMLLRALMQEI